MEWSLKWHPLTFTRCEWVKKKRGTRLSSLWLRMDFLPMATVSAISRLLEIFLITASANDKFISTCDGVMTRKHIPHYRTFGEYPPDSLPSASDVGHWCGFLSSTLANCWINNCSKYLRDQWWFFNAVYIGSISWCLQMFWSSCVEHSTRSFLNPNFSKIIELPSLLWD